MYNEKIRENWLIYSEFYKRTHVSYDKTAKNFMKDIEKSNKYKLIEKISNLNLPNIRDINSISSKLTKNREICKDTKLTDLSDLKRIDCSYCYKSIVDLVNFIEEDDKNEESISQEIDNIIEKRINYLKNNLSDFNKYLFDNEVNTIDSEVIIALRETLKEFNIDTLNKMIPDKFSRVCDIFEKISSDFNKFVLSRVTEESKKQQILFIDFIDKINSIYTNEITSKGVEIIGIKEMISLYRKVLSEIEKQFTDYECNIEEI